MSGYVEVSAEHGMALSRMPQRWQAILGYGVIGGYPLSWSEDAVRAPRVAISTP